MLRWLDRLRFKPVLGRMRFRDKAGIVAAGAIAAVLGAYFGVTRINLNPSRGVGEIVDNFDGVAVYLQWRRVAQLRPEPGPGRI